jgi:hypothetical protein
MEFLRSRKPDRPGYGRAEIDSWADVRLRTYQALSTIQLINSSAFNQAVRMTCGPALVANSLCPGQEKHTMNKLEN